MSAIILDGKKIAESIFAELKKQVESLNFSPRLAIIHVGQDPASLRYIGQKKKRGEEIGVKVEILTYDDKISASKLRAEVSKISRQSISGLIVQLPLPKHIEAGRVLNAIPPRLDVDVLGKTAFGAFALGSSPILPPTIASVLRLLQETGVKLHGQNVVVVGSGRLVGIPMAIEAMREGATLSVINEDTQNPGDILQKADILITGTPAASHIKSGMLKKGVIVIDGGYVRSPKGKISGNVDLEDVKEKALYVTPVPGGVGALTVAMLFTNLLKLASMRRHTKNKVSFQTPSKRS